MNAQTIAVSSIAQTSHGVDGRGRRRRGMPAAMGALAVGLCVGGLTQILPFWVLLVTPLAIAALWMTARSPELGILGVLLYTSTVLSEEQLPPVPIGIGSLHLSDLLILWLFAVLLFRVMVARNLRLQRTPLDVPLALFVMVAVTSTAAGIIAGSIDFDTGVREVRYVGYLVLFFLIVSLIDDEVRMRRLWTGVMLLAGITAVASVVQTVLGPSVPILPGRVESLKTQGVIHEGIARVIPPGESLLYVTVVLAILGLTRVRGSAAAVRQLAWSALLGAGLLLTYRRMLWGGVALALMTALVMIPRQQRARLIRFGLAGIVAFTLAVAGLLVLAPKSDLSRSIAATGERLTSIFAPSSYRADTDTFEGRAIELKYALPQVMPPSLFGIGLGAGYRPCVATDDTEHCERINYLHNGYVAILLKLGAVGFACFILLSAMTLLRGLRGLRSPRHLARRADSDWARRLLIGCTLAFAALLVALMLEPYFLLWSWTPVIALTLATVHWLTLPAPAATDALSSRRTLAVPAASITR